MKKHILAVFVSSSVLVLTACGGGDGDSTSVIVDDGAVSYTHLRAHET